MEIRERLINESQRQLKLAEELCSRQSVDQLLWRPRDNKWSVAEHLTHLALTTDRYNRALKVALHRARKQGSTGDGPARGTLSGRLFLKALEPPVRLKTKTFRQLVPPPHLDVHTVLAAFRRSQQEFEDVVHASEGVDIGASTLRSPFLHFLRLTLAEALEAILAHNRRHFWHIERVLGHPRFPG
jgi:hypothetical protein